MGINEVKQIGGAGIVKTLHGLPVAEVSMEESVGLKLMRYKALSVNVNVRFLFKFVARVGRCTGTLQMHDNPNPCPHHAEVYG